MTDLSMSSCEYWKRRIIRGNGAGKHGGRRGDGARGRQGEEETGLEVLRKEAFRAPAVVGVCTGVM